MSDGNNCTSCEGGGESRNPNPLDPCTRSFLQCDNPCAIVEHNTVQCESLPSRVENFTKNFFGDVVRTEVDGQVVWSLPCGLDVGLPANPRGLDEGLACYFLRLFNDGIVGLTGPAGENGQTGAAGHNAYTVTLAGFLTPAQGGSVTVQTLYNPGILVGSYVFVDTSGWYQVTAKTISGLLTLMLLIAAPGAGFISSGKLVVPSGQPGETIVGPKGDTGFQGPPGPVGAQGATGATGATGPAGNNLLANNNSITGFGGSDFVIPQNLGNYDLISFGFNQLQFTATAVGTYVVIATFDVKNIAGGDGSIAICKIQNTTLSADVTGAATFCGPMVDQTEQSVALMGLVHTTAINQVIGVLATNGRNANETSVIANRSTLVYYQIA